MGSMPWLTSYPNQLPKVLTYPEASLASILIDTTEAYPSGEAIYFLGKRITYQRLLNDVYKLANALKDIGVSKGDRVSINLPNCPQYVIAYYGILSIGAIVVQTNPLLTERELLYQYNDTEVKAVICLDLVFPKVKNIMEKCKVEHVIVTSIKDFLPFPKNILYPLKQKLPTITYDSMILKWQTIMKDSPPSPVLEKVSSREDVAVIQYTGGTTGLPKGVMLTHHNLLANTIQCRSWIYRGSREKVLAAVPFFHVYGMTVAMNFTIYSGGTMVMLPKFEPKDALRVIEKEKPALFPGAPTMYIALLQYPKVTNYDLASIEACISGSAPLPLEIQYRFEQLTGGRIVEGYGLSEASPVTHCNPIWEKRINGSIGLPWIDTEALIVNDETGEEVPIGEYGEIVVRGPQIMKGYWNKEKETAETIKDGWLYTGDIGYTDENGYFYVVDRKKDVIIASGFNVYPREVEEVLYEHSCVEEAAVIGVPDDYRGETVKAFVVVKKDKLLTEEDLDHFCRERLASYKVPKSYEFRKELPKSFVGKILRRALVEEEQGKKNE